MDKKFDTREYKRLADFFPGAVIHTDPGLLTLNRQFYGPRDGGLVVPMQEGTTLEDMINLGGVDQEKNPGERIQITGYVLNAAPTAENEPYAFDLVPDLEHRDLSVICHVSMRDGKNSRLLLNKIGYAALQQQYPLQQAQQMHDTDQGGMENQNIMAQSQQPISIVVYGTLQHDGHVFLEVDGAQIGNNLIYHNKRNPLGLKR